MTAPTTRRTGRRAPKNNHSLDAVLVGVVVAIVAGLWLYSEARRHIAAAIGICVLLLLVSALVAAGVVAYKRHRLHVELRRRVVIANLDAMDGKAFELEIARLCVRDGCSAKRVGGKGDFAADVLVTLPGRKRWQVWKPRPLKLMIQCKRYAAHRAVASDTMQQINGTYRDQHGADRAMLVTTSRITKDARQWANKMGIICVDREALTEWARDGRNAPWLRRI